MDDIRVGIYRRLDNRLEGLDDNSERALELHNIRKEALHDVLDKQEIARVVSWGETDDSSPHEYVEIILSVITTALAQPLLMEGIKKLGEKLAEKAIDETTSQFVKWIIAKFTKKQKEKKIIDFNIRLKDGTYFRVDPPDGTSDITVHFRDGEVASIKYEFGK